MGTKLVSRKAWCLALTGVAAISLISSSAAGLVYGQDQSSSFANPAFQRVWERTDLPVAQGRLSRTWLWGPAPGKSIQEPFKEGLNGTHLVQYFDKARMEINNPNGDPSDPFFVTNGLLVVEMISRKVQKGVNEFDSAVPNDQPVAGEVGSDAPSYAALSSVASVGLSGADNRARLLAPGDAVPSLYINRSGAWTGLAPYAVPAQLKAAAYVNETGHNIPDIFWSYLNSEGSEGLVYQNGALVNGKMFDLVTAVGYPVTEPYWTRIKVAGKDRLVLFQAFQRRVLTYSPANPGGWQVEMGNVGAQYYSWRYDSPSPEVAR